MRDDFLLADWSPTEFPHRSDVKGWIRDDAWLLTYEIMGDAVLISAVSPDARESGRALLDRHATEDRLILTPLSRDRDVVADALQFWSRRPSIHFAALELAEQMSSRGVIQTPSGQPTVNQERGRNA